MSGGPGHVAWLAGWLAECACLPACLPACLQVGCLLHEFMCGYLPFEAEDKMLAAALILWSDIVSFPDHISVECTNFIQVCVEGGGQGRELCGL